MNLNHVKEEDVVSAMNLTTIIAAAILDSMEPSVQIVSDISSVIAVFYPSQGTILPIISMIIIISID